MVKNSEKIGQNPMMRSFSELTKDFDPERRERIEQRKEQIRQCLDLPPHLNSSHGSHHHAHRNA
jgi:hypothetical protein